MVNVKSQPASPRAEQRPQEVGLIKLELFCLMRSGGASGTKGIIIGGVDLKCVKSFFKSGVRRDPALTSDQISEVVLGVRIKSNPVSFT